MAKFSFNEGSIRRVQANITAAGEKKKKQLAAALNSWSIDLVAEIGKEIIAVGAFDIGFLHGATHANPVVDTGTRLSQQVVNEMEYASIVEFGRQPGSKWPPIAPLIGWAKRHGIISLLPENADINGEYQKQWEAAVSMAKNLWTSPGGGGKTAKSNPVDPIVHELLIIRLMQKKIGMQGIAGRHPFSIAFDRKAQTFASDIAKALQLMK